MVTGKTVFYVRRARVERRGSDLTLSSAITIPYEVSVENPLPPFVYSLNDSWAVLSHSLD